MITTDTAIDTFFDAWNETDDSRRAELVAAAWSVEAALTDPINEVTGHDAIVAAIGEAQIGYPGHRFERTSGVDAHHGYLRFSWRMVDAAGAEVVDGYEVAKLDDDGRFAGTVGFFGPLPD